MAGIEDLVKVWRGENLIDKYKNIIDIKRNKYTYPGLTKLGRFATDKLAHAKEYAGKFPHVIKSAKLPKNTVEFGKKLFDKAHFEQMADHKGHRSRLIMPKKAQNKLKIDILKTIASNAKALTPLALKGLSIAASLPAQVVVMTLAPTKANADEINMTLEDFAKLAKENQPKEKMATGGKAYSTDIKDYYRRAWGLEDRPKFKYGGSWADWMTNFSDQMTFEEYLQMDLKEKKPHILDRKAEGGRIGFSDGPPGKVRFVKPTYGLSGYEKRKLSGDQRTYQPTSYDKNVGGEYRYIEGATTSKDKFGSGVKLNSSQVAAIKADLPKGVNLVPYGPKHNRNWYYQFDFYPGGGFKKSKPPIKFSSVAATDANLDLILDEHERLSKQYHSKRMSNDDFKEWRLQPENVELTREEVAKKLNKMGKTTMLDNKWTVSNINMLQDKLGLKFIRGEADAIKIIKELAPNSKQVIKKINAIPDLKLREQTFRQEANRLISADTAAKRYGNFEPSGGPEGKLWRNFWEASVGTKTGDRIKMSGTFNGKSLRFEKNWPRDKNGYVDWQAIDPKTGQPAWKQVTFTDMTTPKGKVTFTYDNLAKQIDDTFGKGSFSRATKAYALQKELYGAKRITDKASGRTLALGQYLARDAIIQEYKALNNGAMPDEDFIQRRMRAYSQAQVHHIEGVEINPYRVQLVSRAANFGVRDAHKKYKSGEYTKKQFIKEIQRISKTHGGIQFMVDGKIYGDKPDPIKVYKSIVKDLKVNKNRSGMIIRGIRNRLANMFQSAPLPKGVKLPIGATAAALDFMIFAGFFGMPLPEAGLGASQWLIKNPEAARRFGQTINAVVEGSMSMREVTEQHGKDLQAIIKDVMGLQMPFEIPKGSMPDSDRLTQMEEMMKVPVWSKIKKDKESGKTYEEGSEIDKSIELEKKGKELAETMSDTEIELRSQYPTASDEEIKEMLRKSNAKGGPVSRLPGVDQYLINRYK